MKTKNDDAIVKIGKPIGGLHGVSVIFPEFKDIINYEEHKIILNRGYPRFVTHPFLKMREDFYKKKYRAIETLCCHSYESAIFLALDYYIKNGIKLYINEGLSNIFFEYFTQRIPNFINKVPIHEADVIITDKQDIKPELKANNQVLILIVEEPTDIFVDHNDLIDIIITHDKLYDIGIILIYADIISDMVLLRRHAGLIPSSRKMMTKKVLENKYEFQQTKFLKKRVSKLELTRRDNCFLFPSGMSAVFFAIYSLISPRKTRFIALGSLYVDTIRILEKWPKKYGLNDTLFITEDFEKKLKDSIEDNTAGIILEFPTNPLLQLIDIEKIVSIAHKKKVNVIVDSTIATPYNFHPFDYNADIVVHSTTKFLNGKNNHIGGVLITNDVEIKKKVSLLKQLTNIAMDSNEIRILSRNIKYFEKRMENINNNSFKIAKFLDHHPKIEKVYYPCLKNNPNYRLAKKYLKGGSGLISFVLKNSSYITAEKFYNHVKAPILKGPSLGSEKTLLSPYVVMAHYNDSKEILKQIGLDFYLMRISIGIEPVDKIKESLDNALKYIS